MSKKNQLVFNQEIKDSVIHWGCQYSSEGEDTYKGIILPFNVGEEVTKDAITWVVESKDWDFDMNTVYFVIVKK